MKIIVRYQKKGPLRFISHLDAERFWRRAGRRACLPVAMTSGFSPKEKIQMGYPLPVGVESEGEDFVMELTEPLSLKEIEDRLSSQIPEGIKIVSVLPYEHKESLFHRTTGLSYRVNDKLFNLPVENGRSPKLWEYLSRQLNLPQESVKLFKVVRIGIQYDVVYHPEATAEGSQQLQRK